MKEKKLTLKQKRLVDEYIKTGNVTQAAINAGYSKNGAGQTGKNTLRNPKVQEYHKQRLKQIDDASIMDMKEVRQRLTRHARGETMEQTTVVTKTADTMQVKGKEMLVYNEEAKTVENQIKPSDQIKALELLGKTGALFTDKTDASLNIKPVKIIDDIPNPDEEGTDN